MMAEERLRIARSVAAIRGDWTVDQVENFLRLHLKNDAYRDVSVALVAVAHIERSQPELVLSKGPWWQAVEKLGGQATVTAQRHPQCEIHKRCPNHDDHPIGANRCPDCSSTLVTDPTAAKELADAARAEIRKRPSAADTYRIRAGRPLPDTARADHLRARIDQEGSR